MPGGIRMVTGLADRPMEMDDVVAAAVADAGGSEFRRSNGVGKFDRDGWGANRERESRKTKRKQIARPPWTFPVETKPVPNRGADDLF